MTFPHYWLAAELGGVSGTNTNENGSAKHSAIICGSSERGIIRKFNWAYTWFTHFSMIDV